MQTPTLEELCQGLKQVYTPAITDIMDEKFGLYNQWLGPEIRPLTPEMKLAGPAFTVRWVNDRTPGGDKLRQTVANMLDGMQAFMVPVLDTSKNGQAGYWGELMCNFCQGRGIDGCVIDGGVRDPYYIWKFGFNMFAAFACPNEADTRSRLDSFQEPISINNVQIRPGDFMVADFGGTVVVPEEIVVDVYHQAKALVEKESEFRKRIREGISGAEAVRTFGRSL